MTGATSHAPLLWVVFACGPRHAHPQHLPHMRHGTASYGPFIIYYILKVVFASGPRHTFPLTFATCGAWNIPSKECNIQKIVFTCGPRQEHPQHLPHSRHRTVLVKIAKYKKSSPLCAPPTFATYEARNSPSKIAIYKMLSLPVVPAA